MLFDHDNKLNHLSSLMNTPLDGELTLEALWPGYNFQGSQPCGKGGNWRGRRFVCTLVFGECECILVILEVLTNLF